jgi:hypothetical protein
LGNQQKEVEKMKIKIALSLLIFLCLPVLAQNAPSSSVDKHFFGRWDMTLNSSGHTYPSWLEIADQNGKLAANYVGRWGNARPLPKIEIKGNHITFVSPKEEEAAKQDVVFDGELKGKHMGGSITGLDGTWTWSAVPAPALDERAKDKNATISWGMPIQIFNGKDLSGWHMSSQGPPEWSVVDGLLVSPGNGPELITDRKFQDFQLHLEFKIGKEANSGVYLRGRYEVQIENESEAEPPSHHTGGVYGFIAPTPEQPRLTDEWESYDITLIGRRVTVVLNGVTVIDNQEIPGITGGALDSEEARPGPIYLQGSEKGHVYFRNIMITPAQ